jgi:hypothetical protein
LFRELIYDIREHKGVATALYAHAWGERIFSFAVEHDYCKNNPAALIKAARVGNRNKRTRWLTTPEIKRYLPAFINQTAIEVISWHYTCS